MKLLNKVTDRFAALAALVMASLAISAPASAAGPTGPDFTALTSAVDFGTTQTAILSVGALAVGLALVVLGIKKIMRVIRGA